MTPSRRYDFSGQYSNCRAAASYKLFNTIIILVCKHNHITSPPSVTDIKLNLMGASYFTLFRVWLGQPDLNWRITGSKPDALPLCYTLINNFCNVRELYTSLCENYNYKKHRVDIGTASVSLHMGHPLRPLHSLGVYGMPRTCTPYIKMEEFGGLHKEFTLICLSCRGLL